MLTPSLKSLIAKYKKVLGEMENDLHSVLNEDDSLTVIDKKQLAMLDRVYKLASSKCETLGYYTELTIPMPGWYYWYPKHDTISTHPRFVLIDDMEDVSGLNYKKYAGEYIGPITPPLPSSQVKEAPPPLKEPPTIIELGNNAVKFLTILYNNTKIGRGVYVEDLPKLQPYDYPVNCLQRLEAEGLAFSNSIDRYDDRGLWGLSIDGMDYVEEHILPQQKQSDANKT